MYTKLFFSFLKKKHSFFLLKYCKNKYIFCVFASLYFYFYFLPFFFLPFPIDIYCSNIYFTRQPYALFFVLHGCGLMKGYFLLSNRATGSCNSVGISVTSHLNHPNCFYCTHTCSSFFLGMCPYPKVLFFVFFVQCKVAELSYCFENRRPLLPPRVTGGDTAEQPVADVKLQSSEPCCLGPGNVLSSRAPLVPLSMP